VIANLILHVVDASVPEGALDEMMRAVDDVLEEIGAGETNRLLVLNKADLLDPAERRRLAQQHRGSVLISAQTGEGLDDLRRRIELSFSSGLQPVELLVPYEQGGVISRLHELARDLEREDTAEGVRVRARLPTAVAEQLRRFDLNGRAPAGDDA
jgi:GTP-binding protein HflX